MANIKLETVPQNKSTWLACTTKYGISNPTTASIHDYDIPMTSGSKVGDIQFLLLRVIWKPIKSPFSRNDYISGEIVPEEYLSTARSLLAENGPWNAYLKWIKERPNDIPEGAAVSEMGQFGMALQSQQYTHRIIDSHSDNSKVDFSPIVTRSRARALQSSQPLRPQTPATPTPRHFDQAGLAGSMDYMDIDEEELEEIYSSPMSSIEQNSPMTGEAARQEGKIKNEQEVVFSLVLFQRAVCNPFKQVAGVTWHPDQDGYIAKNKNGEKTFSAFVDAVMRVKGSTRTPVFDETKRGFRFETPGGAPIKAQESCQMAAKIAQQPPENLQEMRDKNLTAREVWVSQDKDEVYIGVGTYNADYVDYISHRPAKFNLAEVQEYGPYVYNNCKSVSELGVILLAIALEQADAK
ncbi:hypothetical protein F5X96DRAFT_643587 [Biscogniauxia mediterranea]|nr:hypothetical protein F5X96DRAFT_643587 [Biscogniauxia mediterranea]